MKYFGEKLGYTKIWRDGMRDGKAPRTGEEELGEQNLDTDEGMSVDVI